jgi:hypothetical protein
MFCTAYFSQLKQELYTLTTLGSAPNILASVCHVCMSAVYAMWKKFKLSLIVVTGSETVVKSGIVCIWWESGVRWSVLCW